MLYWSAILQDYLLKYLTRSCYYNPFYFDKYIPFMVLKKQDDNISYFNECRDKKNLLEYKE